jgi:peptidoglycan/xylan/chitin deacetylase (PgdA/CDA1 family)
MAVCLVLLLTAWRLHKSRDTQLFGEFVTELSTADSVIALTFDDGPVPIYTDSVLALLERESVPATFFVIGRSVMEHPDLTRRILRNGHEVGNHSYSHDRMVLMSMDRIRSEVETTDSLLREAGAMGRIPFRPPYGKRLVGLPWYLWRTGRVTVLWSLEPDSWFGERDDMVQHVVENIHPGAIILLHVEIGSRTEERAALPLLIHELKQQGYRFVTVSEMLALGQS